MMKPSDDWIMLHLPGTAPEMARQWMDETGVPEWCYTTVRMSIRNRLKVLERYRIVQWTGIYHMVTNTAAKIYEAVI